MLEDPFGKLLFNEFMKEYGLNNNDFSGMKVLAKAQQGIRG